MKGKENIDNSKVQTASPPNAALPVLAEPTSIQSRRYRRKRKTETEAGKQTRDLYVTTPMPLIIWLISLALAVWGASTPNPALTLGSATVLLLLFKLLWREGEAPILLMCCLGQWLQVVMPLILANYYSQTLEAHFGIPLRSEATSLGLIGVAVFALGLRIALVGRDLSFGPAAELEISGFSVNRLFLAWLFSFIVTVPIDLICRFVPGLTQVALPLVGLKTGFVFLLGYAVIRQQQGRALFAFVVVIEFFAGTLGFFSGFRQVFNVLMILLLTVTHRWTFRTCLLYLALGTTIVVSVSAWSALKSDYREFLNQGSRQQEVVVPIPQRVQYLVSHIPAMQAKDIANGFERTLERIGYTEYFADTLNNIPKMVPYQRGQLWWDATTRIFMPRMFFPDKPVVDDSYRTQVFAGADVAGAEKGASIGMGYMAESYADFGSYFMCLPIFLLALLFGLIYRHFVLRAGVGSWGYVFAFAMPSASLHMFETSNIKLVGAMVASSIIFLPLNYYLGQSFKKWLRAERTPQKNALDMQ